MAQCYKHPPHPFSAVYYFCSVCNISQNNFLHTLSCIHYPHCFYFFFFSFEDLSLCRKNWKIDSSACKVLKELILKKWWWCILTCRPGQWFPGHITIRTHHHLSAPLPSVTVSCCSPAGGKRQTLQIGWNIIGNIMRQPAAVMARGFWLIELLPMLHTEQDLRTAEKVCWDTGCFFEDISSLLVNVGTENVPEDRDRKKAIDSSGINVRMYKCTRSKQLQYLVVLHVLSW